MISSEQAQEFINTAHQAAEFNLLKCSSGNLSMRLSDRHVAVSASGAWLGSLQPEQIAICDIETGESLNSIKPSIESYFHVGILKHRRDVNVVLHFQSSYATILACSNPENYIDKLHNTIEMPAYIGQPAIVEYAMPGSMELAESIIDKFKTENTNIAILKNHGQVSIGVDSKDAIQKAVFFEMNCMIALTSLSLKSLSTDQQKEIADLGKA